MTPIWHILRPTDRFRKRPSENSTPESSPIPRWDTPKLHQAAHLTLLSAGREKRLYAVPPYTDVYPLEFNDVPFQIERQDGRVCAQTGARQKFMNEIPQEDGSTTYQLSDTGYAEKLARLARGEPAELGPTYYDDEGGFYLPGLLKPTTDDRRPTTAQRKEESRP